MGSRRSTDAESEVHANCGIKEILQAILSLIVDERERRLAEHPGDRTEIVLARAGLSAQAIATLLNKQVATVQMTLYRSKLKGRKTSPSTERQDA